MKYTVTVGERTLEATVLQRSAAGITFEVSGCQYTVGIQPHGGTPAKTLPASAVRTSAPTRTAAAARPRTGSGEVRAPMPGIVVQVVTTLGATVAVGDPLIVIEAMKMENCLNASVAGKVLRIETQAGKQVNGGDLLIVIGE